MELQNKENTNIPLYEKQLRDAESGIQNMLNAIQAGILTSSTKERLEQLEETKRELEARIAEEKLAKPKIKEEFIRFWLMRFRKLDMSQMCIRDRVHATHRTGCTDDPYSRP